MQFKFWKKSELASKNNLDNTKQGIKQEIFRELLSQQRDRHKFGLAISTASALMTIFSVGLLYFNKVSEANFTAGSSVLMTLTSIQYNKQVKEELCEMMEDLEE